MSLWVVFRHGWDEANQSASCGLPEKMAVIRVEAASAEEACRLAAQRVSVTASQHLSAEPAPEVDTQVTDLNRRSEAIEEEAGQREP